ncbi:Bacteriocin-protection, YdeI or OmpD-Associated [Chitinophaga sp. YR627]|uniref:YdeI/OmpD-associated family protein n=1 Tax=Chitinophaga sp. YR627 TaxID=1881041 RepID=UPI0008EA93ED|nr:YdeI/OmpD-associated family protein [Chitinophaga sp. YR627]SFO34341.1 Bacteriocin-protection, YdeI or OmpD-Associated [Chitinophaga sp. YR627]
MSRKVTFDAVIQQHGGMNAGYVVFPYDVQELFGVKGQVKVKALIDGKVTYRGSLTKMNMPEHWLGITQVIRRQLGKELGDTIHVELEQDLEVREVLLTDEVVALFAKHPKAEVFYNQLSYTDRKEYMVWITSAKREETRQNRLTLMIEKLEAGKKVTEK